MKITKTMGYIRSTILEEGNPRSSLGCTMLCVDPGLEGTGWAYWHCTGLHGAGRRVGVRKQTAQVPYSWGVIKPDSVLGRWYIRAWNILSQFDSLLEELQPELVVMEFQEEWAGSEISRASVSSGNLFKLTWLSGMLVGSAYCYTPYVFPLLPREWKGQLPKDVVSRRLKIRCGIEGIQNHACDAVGMGMSCQNYL